MDDDEELRVVQDRPYDESLDVADDEEVESVYTPVPSERKPPAPDTNAHAHQRMGGLSRERPIHRRQDDSPPLDDDPPHDINNGENTPDESESEEHSFQPSHDARDQQEYKHSEPDPDVYDPKMYHDLPVTGDVKEIFSFIEKYQPQDIVLETKLKPFVPEYVPSIGDIDAFLKVPRPDGKEDGLGLAVLDEPSSRQSDPHVLNLQMRYTSKQPVAGSMLSNVRTVTNADNNPKAIEEWVHNISKLQKSKTADTVQYRKPLPNVDDLMQEWPAQFEDLLREASVPPADLDTDLATYIDIACALLDIPVYENRIQSLHAVFSLYLGFKNSEHFKTMMDTSEPSYHRRGDNTGADQMIID